MRPKHVFLLSLLIPACASSPSANRKSAIEIKEIHPSGWTTKTREALEGLLVRYDLSPFLFTKTVRIQSGVVPHSHPVLTLNTFHADDPDAILDEFLHEQMHWFLAEHESQTDTLISELKKTYPVLPRGRSEVARSEESTYLHLIVGWLELQAVRHYLGSQKAEEILGSSDHYKWI